MTVAVRLTGDAAERGAFAVPSRSRPGEVHTVIWIGGGTYWCDCDGFDIRRRCRHVDQVGLAIEVEAREAKASTTPESRAAAASRLQAIEEEFAR